MGKLFGTDGIRGKANTPPIDCETALKVGRALAVHFGKSEAQPRIAIGRDTRISGVMLEQALSAGICSMGGTPYLLDIIPTPGTAWFASAENMDAGVVISASHNPYFDNGIKIFDGKGFKLTDAEEDRIESLIFSGEPETICRNVTRPGGLRRVHDAADRYRGFVKASNPAGLSGVKIVLDCANGALFRIAPRLFAELGADIHVLADNPDGVNINENCGSEHTKALCRAVVEQKAHMGFAFDGDGDRLVCVDDGGEAWSGDRITAFCARHMKDEGTLKNNVVVTTVMSNMGLIRALKKMGIAHFACAVGDRHVKETMLEKGAVLGGEDSGHMIFLDGHTTGDGIFSALRLIAAWQAHDKPLSSHRDVMTLFPQEMINVDVREKPPVDSVPEISEAISAVEKKLGENGRVLVRYSGTQPLCRVMVEGPDETVTREFCRKIADVVRNTLGAG